MQHMLLDVGGLQLLLLFKHPSVGILFSNTKHTTHTHTHTHTHISNMDASWVPPGGMRGVLENFLEGLKHIHRSGLVVYMWWSVTFVPQVSSGGGLRVKAP